MYYLIMILILILFMNLQAMFFSILLPLLALSNSMIVPNILLATLVFICLVRDDRNIVYVAFLIGIINDIVFGSYIGIYAFIYTFIAYWVNFTFRIFVNRSVMVFVLSVFVANVAFELLYWGITVILSSTSVKFYQIFNQHFFISLLILLVISALIYRPVVSYLENKGIYMYD